MKWLDWIGKILPGGYVRTTSSLTDIVKDEYVEAYKKASKKSTKGVCEWCNARFKDSMVATCPLCGGPNSKPRESVEVRTVFSAPHLMSGEAMIPYKMTPTEIVYKNREEI